MLILVMASVSASAGDWPAFRGEGARGVADGAHLPLEWDVATSKNVRWVTEVPGMGHSSPIVWGHQLFVTTAVAAGRAELELGDTGGIKLADAGGEHSWRLLSIDTRDGRVMWEKEAYTGEPRTRRHVKSSQANATPATDGETVVALFGSQGIVAYDLEGNEKWRKDLGKNDPGLDGDTSSQWGAASSPVLHGGRVFVQVDRHADSFLVAIEAESGAEIWRVERDERPVWATPTLHVGDERSELIVRGGHYDRAYDPADGRELWRYADDAEVKSTTAFVADGLVLLTGGYRGRPMTALRLGGSGDLSPAEGGEAPFLAWRSEVGGPYTSTPVAYDDLLYLVRDEGILQIHDLKTGDLVHRVRTGATHAASLLASDGHVFVASEDGEVLVYRAGREAELVARNQMGEVVMATPAIANGTLFVRTLGHLYAIAAAR